MGSDAMFRNAKPAMVDDVESPIGGETLDREKLPVSKFLRTHLTFNVFVVHDSARSNTNKNSLFHRSSIRNSKENQSDQEYPRFFHRSKSWRK
jgi:hypothetical protein